ncbi:MAG: hypothetical protein ACQEXQ_29105 [Bacillota bacterium]
MRSIAMKMSLFIFASALLVTGCNKQNESLSESNPLTISSEVKDISIHVTIDKLVFIQGEKINVLAEIKNNGEQAYIHHGSGNCDNTIYFSIKDENENGFFLGEGSVQPHSCTEDYSEFSLQSGTTINERASFTTRIENDLKGEVKNAEKGQFTLVARYGDIRISFPISID